MYLYILIYSAYIRYTLHVYSEKGFCNLHIEHPSQHLFLAAHSSIALQTLGLATCASLGQLLLSKFEAISRPEENHTHFRILMDFSVDDFVEHI